MLRTILLNTIRKFPALYAGLKAIHSHKVVNRPAVDTPIGFRMNGLAAMQNGTFEPDETHQISKLLENVEIVVNIGANTGYYVCLARKMGKKVIAIEPLDQNVQIMQRNIQANGWQDVEILPIGLGDSVGQLKLYGGGTAASLVKGWAGARHDHYRLVPVSTLDNVLSDRFGDQKMLILIDVEGFELNVLKGAFRQLQRKIAPIWFVEICIDEHQPDCRLINPNLTQTFDFFFSRGYSAEKAGASSGGVTRQDVLEWQSGKSLPATHNFIFKKI
jgi:FkbM family methyltransferase